MTTNETYIKTFKKIENFIQSRENAFKKYLVNNQIEYSKYLNKLEFFYWVTNYLSSQKFKAIGNEVVLVNLFTKSSLDLYGIFYCLKNGLEIQAQEISRCLYETYITVELILKEDTPERLKLFNDFQHVQRWNQIQFHIKHDSTFICERYGLTKEYLEVLEKKYKEVIINYHPKNPSNWAWKIFKDNKNNPTMLEICKYLGQSFVDEYIITYPTLSITSHPTQIIADYFTKENIKNNVIVNSPNYTNLTKETTCICIKDCGMLIIGIMNYLKPDNYVEYIEFIKIYLSKVFELGYDNKC